MDVKQDLNAALEPQSAPFEQSCPTCGDSWDGVTTVSSSLFTDEPLTCCIRCGSRFLLSGEGLLPVSTCDRCHLPYSLPVTGAGSPVSDVTPDLSALLCADCEEGGGLGCLTDPAIAEATETEIQLALAESWDLVSMPALQVYLDRLIRELAHRIEGGPQDSRVLLFDDDSLKTLALSSGTVFISRGLLEMVKDEAELVFVLARELAHAASPATPSWLVRIGMRVISNNPAGASRAAWLQAAEEAIRLGHGLAAESDADLKALEVVRALGYDARSALRFITRLQQSIERDAPEILEFKTAHPAPVERRRLVEHSLAQTINRETVLKINREPYRRAAGPDVLIGGLRPLSDFDPLGETAERATARRIRDRGFVWSLLALVLLVLLFLLVGNLLSN